MLTEEELAHLLHRQMEDVTAPTGAIVAGSLIRGRRMRRHRNAARIVSGSGVVAVAAVLGVVAFGNITGTTSGIEPANPGTPVDTNVPTTHQFGVPADRTAQVLASLLPAGATRSLNNHAPVTDPRAGKSMSLPDGPDLKNLTSGHTSPGRSASLVFDDGNGASLVEVSIQGPEPGAAPTLGTVDLSSPFCQEAGIACEVVTGGMLVTETPASPGSTTEGVKSASAIYQSDGWAVTVTAYNAKSDKDGAVTRTAPPLTTAQLAKVATYAGWLK